MGDFGWRHGFYDAISAVGLSPLQFQLVLQSQLRFKLPFPIFSA